MAGKIPMKDFVRTVPSARVVQYCRPESSRILLLSIGKPEVSWCKVLPSVWMHWTRIDSDGKVHFSIRERLRKIPLMLDEIML